jgi:hypothetical protein
MSLPLPATATAQDATLSIHGLSFVKENCRGPMLCRDGRLSVTTRLLKL